MRPSQNECLMTRLHSSPGTVPACNYILDLFFPLCSAVHTLHSKRSTFLLCFLNFLLFTIWNSTPLYVKSKKLKLIILMQYWSNYFLMTPFSMTLHYLWAIEFTHASSLANCFINGELGTPYQSVSDEITHYEPQCSTHHNTNWH